MGAFSGLVSTGDVGRVTVAFERMIEASFTSHPIRHLTQDEIKRRFEMLSKIFRYLRGDLKWSLERIFDKIPTYFGCELDGSVWEPDARLCWMPGEKP